MSKRVRASFFNFSSSLVSDLEPPLPSSSSVLFVEVFLGHVVVVFVGVREAVYHGRITTLSWRISSTISKLRQSSRATLKLIRPYPSSLAQCAWRFHFTFARQQFNGTHFTHVHAHGVGGASKLAVNRREGGFRSSSASSSLVAVPLVLLSSRVSASGVCSYTATPMSFNREMTTSSVSASTNLSGRWSLIHRV